MMYDFSDFTSMLTKRINTIKILFDWGFYIYFNVGLECYNFKKYSHSTKQPYFITKENKTDESNSDIFLNIYIIFKCI